LDAKPIDSASSAMMVRAIVKHQVLARKALDYSADRTCTARKLQNAAKKADLDLGRANFACSDAR